MPITEELKNVKKFEAVGFTHEQAEVLAESIEESIVSGQEDLKEFIRSELKALDIKLTNKIDQDIKDLKIAFLESQKDLLLKFIGIMSAIVGIAVAIIKLF